MILLKLLVRLRTLMDHSQLLLVQAQQSEVVEFLMVAAKAAGMMLAIAPLIYVVFWICSRSRFICLATVAAFAFVSLHWVFSVRAQDQGMEIEVADAADSTEPTNAPPNS